MLNKLESFAIFCIDAAFWMFIVVYIGLPVLFVCVALLCFMAGIPYQAVVPIFLFLIVATIVAGIAAGAAQSGNE